MNEVRLDAALRALGKSVPKAPEKTVDEMVKTVRALNAAKQKRAAVSTPAAQIQPEKNKELSGEKLPKAPTAGMKK